MAFAAVRAPEGLLMTVAAMFVYHRRGLAALAGFGQVAVNDVRRA
jgi:hypothetical protein